MNAAFSSPALHILHIYQIMNHEQLGQMFAAEIGGAGTSRTTNCEKESEKHARIPS